MGQGQIRSSLQLRRHQRSASHSARVRPRGHPSHHSTGDGDDIAYWNRYVGVTQMGGHGSFSDARTGVNVTNGRDDLITSKLPALQAYQLSLPHRSRPPAASIRSPPHAERPCSTVRASASSCHSGTHLTDANERLHPPSRCRERARAQRRPKLGVAKRDQTVPDRALARAVAARPYFHNGSAPTLEAVVQTYNTKKSLGLSETAMSDLSSTSSRCSACVQVLAAHSRVENAKYLKLITFAESLELLLVCSDLPEGPAGA